MPWLLWQMKVFKREREREREREKSHAKVIRRPRVLNCAVHIFESVLTGFGKFFDVAAQQDGDGNYSCTRCSNYGSRRGPFLFLLSKNLEYLTLFVTISDLKTHCSKCTFTNLSPLSDRSTNAPWFLREVGSIQISFSRFVYQSLEWTPRIYWL